MSEECIHESGTAQAFRVIGSVLENYLALKEQATQHLIQLSSGVLESWLAAKEKCAEANLSYGVDFNPLRLIPIKEPIHSKVIGDFLNPKGSHGQGPLFLQSFLEWLEVPEREEGHWQISIETGRVDILLWRDRPAAMILIENKVKGAQDQPNQLYRYWHHQMFLWKPEHWRDEKTRRSFRLIYLPADGSKAPAPHSLERPSDWGDEVNKHETVPLECDMRSLQEVMKLWQDRALKEVPASNQRLHVFFHLYKELWTQP
jgi:hypothetical protein